MDPWPSARIASATCSPFSSGIRMSMSRMSGSAARTRASACRPPPLRRIPRCRCLPNRSSPESRSEPPLRRRRSTASCSCRNASLGRRRIGRHDDFRPRALPRRAGERHRITVSVNQLQALRDIVHGIAAGQLLASPRRRGVLPAATAAPAAAPRPCRLRRPRRRSEARRRRARPSRRYVRRSSFSPARAAGRSPRAAARISFGMMHWRRLPRSGCRRTACACAASDEAAGNAR